MVQRTHNAIVYLRNQSAKDKQQKKNKICQTIQTMTSWCTDKRNINLYNIFMACFHIKHDGNMHSIRHCRNRQKLCRKAECFYYISHAVHTPGQHSILQTYFSRFVFSMKTRLHFWHQGAAITELAVVKNFYVNRDKTIIIYNINVYLWHTLWAHLKQIKAIRVEM